MSEPRHSDPAVLPVNVYSPRWRTLFERGYGSERTAAEVAFLTRQLPLPGYRDVLDIGTGIGRHASLLAPHGYTVTAIDVDEPALAEARRRAPANVTFKRHDMRELRTLAGSFSAVLNLWSSFGLFDRETNVDVLRAMTAKLRPRGRLVLDVFNRAFFEPRQGPWQFVKGGRAITEHKTIVGRRLAVRLHYGDEGADDEAFEWEVYTPDELSRLAEAFGLSRLLVCSNYDERTDASASVPRMQLVFERTHPG